MYELIQSSPLTFFSETIWSMFRGQIIFSSHYSNSGRHDPIRGSREFSVRVPPNGFTTAEKNVFREFQTAFSALPSEISTIASFCPFTKRQYINFSYPLEAKNTVYVGFRSLILKTQCVLD